MRWEAIARAEPALSRLCDELLLAPGVVLVGTTRADGTPRVSAVEPYVLDGDLLLTMLWGSRKAADLRRDPRVLVHSIVTSRDGQAGEVKLRGTAVPLEPTDRFFDAVEADLGWRPDCGRVHVFAVDVASVAYLRYRENGDQHVVVWPPGTEALRRATGATSVGPPARVTDVLQSPGGGRP